MNLLGIPCIVENTATPTPAPMARTHLKKQSPINGLANRGRVVRPIAMKGEEVPYLRGLLALFGPRRGERCVHSIAPALPPQSAGLSARRGRGKNLAAAMDMYLP